MEQDIPQVIDPDAEKPDQADAPKTQATAPKEPDEIALAGYETINYLIQRGLLEKR